MSKIINIIEAIQAVIVHDYELATKDGDMAAMLRIPGEQEHYKRAVRHANEKVDTIVH